MNLAMWTTQDWILAASLVGNVAAAIAVFFKSALNDIVKERHKSHRERKERERNILLELNARMNTYHSDYFMLLVNLGLSHMATTPADQALADESMRRVEESLQSTKEFFDRHDLEFPRLDSVADFYPATVDKDTGGGSWEGPLSRGNPQPK